MTSKLVVNTIEADTGISSVSFGSSISLSSTSKFFFGAAGIDIGADTNINRPASGVLGFNINGSEKARIDSSGRVLIGTTTEGSTSADTLTIAESSNSGITIRSGASNAGHIYFSDGTSGADEYRGIVFYDHASNYMAFWTNGDSEKLRIDSIGRVLIGTTTEGSTSADDLTVATSGTTGITIRSGTSNNGNIEFSDGTSGQDEYRGIVQYAHSDNSMRFYTNATEKVRIDSSGRLLVGSAAITYNQSPLYVSGTDPVVATFHHSDGGTNDEARIALGALVNNPPFNRGVYLTAKNNGNGHDFIVATSASHAAGPSEKLRIASDGDMGVGTNSPSARLHVNGGDGLLVERSAGTSIAGFKHSGASAMNIYFQNTGSTNHPYIGSSNQDLILGTNNSERLRIDSAGRFLKGLTGSGASRSSTSVRYPHFQLSSPWSSGLGSYKIECTDDYPIIFIDSNASYANGSGAGVITWSVKDGSGDYCNTASVRSLIDGTPSNDNAPGRLEFMTTTSGTSPTTKMTISSEGHITKPNQPSCMAYNAQGQHMSGGAIAQFNSTRFNIGSHYNSSNGRFTAPVAGRYLVAYSGLHDYQGQSTTGFAIRLNGSEFDGGEAYDQVYGSSNSHQCQLAKTLILNMSANDYVQIYIRSSGTQVHQRYGSFSVCLLT